MEFRIVTALLVLGTFLIASTYRLRAAQTGERIPRTHEGPVTRVALRLGGLVALLFGVICGFLVARTRTEETFLVERFGDDYLEYSSRVGRFFPRF